MKLMIKKGHVDRDMLCLLTFAPPKGEYSQLPTPNAEHLMPTSRDLISSFHRRAGIQLEFVTFANYHSYK